MYNRLKSYMEDSGELLHNIHVQYTRSIRTDRQVLLRSVE